MKLNGAAAACLIVLAACNALPGPGPTQGNSWASDRKIHLSATPSWILPEARSKDLIYVSSQTDNEYVYIFSYPNGKPEGELAGFFWPAGECADKAGNVFITNYDGAYITEYAHGGLRPILRLKDQPYSNPIDCAIDPVSGDLAVANAFSGSGSGGGNIALYRGARGAPKYYSDPNLFSVRACAFDDQGHLFVDGEDHQLGFALAELARGASSFAAISVPENKSFYDFPIQWDGKYLAIGYGSSINVIRRLRISGSHASLAGSVDLAEGYSVDYFSFAAKRHANAKTDFRLIGPEYNSGDAKIWNYPSGTLVSTMNGAGVPVGAVVSFARRPAAINPLRR